MQHFARPMIDLGEVALRTRARWALTHLHLKHTRPAGRLVRRKAGLDRQQWRPLLFVVVGVRKRAWRFACYLNNDYSAIAAQLGEVTATKTQQARETGVRVVWPAAGRDGGGTTTTTTARPARTFATSPRLASAIFAPPPAPTTRAQSAESRLLRYVPPALKNTIKERNGCASHRGVGAQPVAVVRTTHGNQFGRIPHSPAIIGRGGIRGIMRAMLGSNTPVIAALPQHGCGRLWLGDVERAARPD